MATRSRRSSPKMALSSFHSVTPSECRRGIRVAPRSKSYTIKWESHMRISHSNRRNEGSDRDARPGLRRIHDAHEGGRHRTYCPSSVRGTTCCGKGTNQAAARIAERPRRGASAEPERRGRPPSPPAEIFSVPSDYLS